jgi:hypothetical protein
MTTAKDTTNVQPRPLFFYRMMPGKSMKVGAIIVNGRTLTGPMLLPKKAAK